MVSPKGNRTKASKSHVIKGSVVGLLSGSVTALLLSRWTWLEMRCNVSRVIPAGVALGILIVFWRKLAVPYLFFLFLQFLFAVTFFSIYGFRWDAFFFIPASMLREAFNMQSIRVEIVNIVMGACILVVNFSWIGCDLLKAFRERH